MSKTLSTVKMIDQVRDQADALNGLAQLMEHAGPAPLAEFPEDAVQVLILTRRYVTSAAHGLQTVAENIASLHEATVSTHEASACAKGGAR